MEIEIIKVFKLIGEKGAYRIGRAELLFLEVSKALDKDKKVIVDWDMINLLPVYFLNISIGQLYGRYDYNLVDERVGFDNLAEDDEEKIVKVIENAKKFFKGEKNGNKIWRNELSETKNKNSRTPF